MTSSDSLTSVLMDRLVDRRASVASRIILRALVRAAIDVTIETKFSGEATPEQHEQILQAIEDNIRDAVAMMHSKAVVFQPTSANVIVESLRKIVAARRK